MPEVVQDRLPPSVSTADGRAPQRSTSSRPDGRQLCARRIIHTARMRSPSAERMFARALSSQAVAFGFATMPAAWTHEADAHGCNLMRATFLVRSDLAATALKKVAHGSGHCVRCAWLCGRVASVSECSHFSLHEGMRGIA